MSCKSLLVLQMRRLKQKQRKVPYSRLEIHWLFHTASPKPQILSHTHSFTLMSAVIGVLTLAMFSEVTSNVISRMYRLLIFTLCKNHNSPLSLLLTATAGLLSMAASCWAFEPHRPCLWSHASPAQRLDSLPWMPQQTEDQTAVISLKMPRVNMCQSQNLFFSIKLIHRCFTVLCCAHVWGFHGGSGDKESACHVGDMGLIRGLGRSLEKEMATHSSILA